MCKSRIARTLICLALVFVLVFNIYAMPTKAVAAGTVVTVGAALFVTAALIALGISAGNSLDDFNSIRDNCTTTLQQAGVIGDYVTGYLVDGKVNFWERLIEAVRNWTNQEEIVDYDGLFYSLPVGQFFNYTVNTLDPKSYTCSVPAECFYLNYNGTTRFVLCYDYTLYGSASFFLSDGSDASFSTTRASRHVDGTWHTFYYFSSAFTYPEHNPSIKQYYVLTTDDQSDLSNAIKNVIEGDYLPVSTGVSSSYDISLGNVAAPDVDLQTGYSDWAAGAISVPGSVVGADTDEDVVSFPLGLGDTVDGTLALDQSAVQSGVGTYTGEEADPNEGGTVDPDVSGAVSASVLAGLLDKLQGVISKRLDSLVNLTTVISDWCKNWWDKLGTTFPTILSEWWQDSVWTHVDDSFDTALIGIRDGISGVKQWVDTAWDDFITTFPTAMSKWWEDVWTHVDDSFDSVLVGIRDGIAGVRTWADSFWDTLTITLPLTLSDWWSKVWADARSIPAFLTDALGLASDKVVTAVNDLIVPPEDYLSDKLNAIKEKYSFVESILATIALIQNALNISSTEPPVIYAELGAAESLYGYDYGGSVAILDMRWYAAYKPTVDKLLSAFFIFCFCWKIFKKLPGYIQGAPDDITFGSSGLPAVTHRTSSFKSDIKSITVRRGR